MQEHTTPCPLVPTAYKSVASATFLCHIWADHGLVDTQSHTLATGLATSLLVILQLHWISDGVIPCLSLRIMLKINFAEGDKISCLMLGEDT